MAESGTATLEGTSSLAQVQNRSRAAREAAVNAGTRPIRPRSAEDAGMFYPHQDMDKRHAQRNRSRQVPVRQQAAPAPEITEDESIVVSRSELVHGVPTGETMKYDRQLRESPARLLGMPIEDRRRLETGEDVLIPPEVVRKNVDFLRNYVASWNRMATYDAPPPAPGEAQAGNMLEHLMRQDAYAADKALLDKLSEMKSDNVRGVVDAADIRKFLSTSSAWGETMMAIERFTLLAETGLGMQTTINHKIYNRQRDDRLRHRQIIIEEDLKMVRGLLKSGVSQSLTSLGALAYFMAGRGKTEEDIRYMAKIVAEVKKAPAAGGMSLEDRAVFRAFTGVNIDNLGIVGTEIVPINDSTTYAQDIEQDVATAYGARKDVMVTLGLGEHPTNGWFTKFKDVDRSRVRTMHEFIYLYAQGYERGQGGRRPEGLRFVSDVQVMEQYSTLVAGAGGAGAVTEIQRLQFMGEALQTVRSRFARDRVEVETSARKKEREADSLTALDAKRTAMDSGEFRKNRLEQAAKRRDDAKTSRETAETRRNELQEKEGSVGKASAEVQTLASELSRMGVDTTGDIEAAFRAREAAIQGDIAAQVVLLDGHVLNRRNEQIAELNAARAAYNVMVAGIPAGTRNIPAFDGAVGEKEAVAERWKPMIDPVQAEIDRFQQQITELRTGYKEFTNATGRQFEATLSLAYSDGERNKLQNAVEARNNLTAAIVTLPGAAVAAALTPIDIANRPAQVLVDALRTAAVPVGENDAERLRWVLQAKAQVEQDNAPLPAYQQNAVVRLNTLPAPNNFSRDVLMIRDPNEVITVLRDLYIAGGLPTDPNLPIGLGNPALPGIAANAALALARSEVLAARLGVSRQLRELSEARLTAEIDNHRATESNAEEQVRNLENLDIPKAQVDVARTVMRRVADGSLLSETRSIADAPRAGLGSAEDRLVTNLGNVAVINAADTRITEAERDGGYVQGLLEWYAFLDPGYQDATNRQELFQGFLRDLPPRRLAQIINTKLGMGIGAGAGVTDQEFVRRVLTRFRNRSRGVLAAPRPTQAQMIWITREMTDNIRAAGAAV